MGSLINIREENQRPLQINTEGFSVLVEHFDDQERQSKQSLLFYSEGQGQFLHAANESWEINTDHVVKQFKEADVSLFEIPFYWGDQKEIGRYFVNPELVQSIIVSGERTSEGETEPHVGLLVDVRGYGRVETYKVPVSVVDELVKTVEAHNPNLMHFSPEDASTRWGPEGYTIIDTTQIRNISPNGWDMDIHFKNGARLDFHLDRGDKVNEASNEYLNRLIKKIRGNGTQDDLLQAVGGNLNNLLPRIGKFQERYRYKLRESFAQAVAAKAPDLVKIENATNVYYTTLDQIKWINTHDEALSLEFTKSALQSYNDSLSIYFKTEEDARKGLEDITERINQASARKPKIL